MARSSNKPVFTPPGWRQALKTKFLDFAFHHNPEALRQLVTEVRRGVITPRQWANRYGVAETWIEEWAGDVLTDWETQPDFDSDVDQLMNSTAPGTMTYPAPRDERTADDVFSFRVSMVPPSKLSLGITMGGFFPEGEPEDDWLRFTKQMHRRLDRALESYRQKAVRLGASREVLIPKDLFLKTEATAVYFFSTKSPEKILPRLVEKVADRTTVYRWIKEIAKLLDIPMKKRPPQN